MKIKQYLEMVENLPRLPNIQDEIKISYLVDRISDNKLNSINYNNILFKQISFRDSTGKNKYKWVPINLPEIDYEVDEIYFKAGNSMVTNTTFNLLHNHKFKFYELLTDNNRYNNIIYINFFHKVVSFVDDKKIKYLEYNFIDDEKIIENLFIYNIKIYPNGIPVSWEKEI